MFTSNRRHPAAPVEESVQKPSAENNSKLEPVFEDLATPQLGTLE